MEQERSPLCNAYAVWKQAQMIWRKMRKPSQQCGWGILTGNPPSLVGTMLLRALHHLTVDSMTVQDSALKVSAMQ